MPQRVFAHIQGTGGSCPFLSLVRTSPFGQEPRRRVPVFGWAFTAPVKPRVCVRCSILLVFYQPNWSFKIRCSDRFCFSVARCHLFPFEAEMAQARPGLQKAASDAREVPKDQMEVSQNTDAPSDFLLQPNGKGRRKDISRTEPWVSSALVHFGWPCNGNFVGGRGGRSAVVALR